MIRTSNYESLKDNNLYTISISRDCGEDAGYTGDVYLDLAPEKSLLKRYHKNIGVIPEEENVESYMIEYWNNVLKKLDPEEVYKELNNKILLCYEKSNEFCHRHVVAAWFEILLEKQIPEIELQNGNLIEVERPKYIRKMLEKIMKENQDMQGFDSLRALYLYNKGNKALSSETEDSYKKYVKEKKTTK